MADEIKQDQPDYSDDPRFKGSFNTEPGTPEPATVSTEPAPVTPDPVTPTPDPKFDQSAFLKSIGTSAGIEIQSEQDIIDALKFKREGEIQLSEAKKRLNELDSIDPFARDLDKAIKSGVDTRLYIEARNMDLEKMDGKEALRREYFLKNAKIVAADPVFAEKKFENEYRVKYSVLNETLTAEERDARRDEIDFAERSKRIDEMNAKEYLTDWKSKNVTIPEVQPVADPVVNQEIVDRYYKQAEDFVKDIGTLDIPVGDETFKLGMEEYSGEILKDLKNPVETLKRLGIDPATGTIDTERFGETLAKLYAIDRVGSNVYDWALEQNAAKTLKATLQKVTPPNAAAGGDPTLKSHDEKVAEAIVAEREARRQQAR